VRLPGAVAEPADRSRSATQPHDADEATAAAGALRVAVSSLGGDGENLDPRTLEALLRLLSEINSRAGATEADEAAASSTPASVTNLSQQEALFIALAEQEIDRLIGTWDTQKNTLEGQAGRAQRKLMELLDQHEIFQAEHRRLRFQQPHTMVSPRIYWTILILIGVLELPFNATAFQVLREQDPRVVLPFLKPSFWMPLGPSVAIVILSHFLGSMIRQWPSNRAHWKLWTMTIVSMGSLVTGLIAVGFLVIVLGAIADSRHALV